MLCYNLSRIGDNMEANLGISYCGLFYTNLMTIVFFNQKRINKFENTIYSFLLLDVLFELVFGILSYYSIICMEAYPILNLIINKIYLLTLGAWAMLFASYVLSISINFNSEKIKETFEKMGLIIFGIMFVWITFTPETFYHKNGIVYSGGLATDGAYAIAIISAIVVVSCIIINRKNLKSKKYIPTFVFIFLGILSMFIQMKLPHLFLVSPLEVFITFLMYFTIENPDVRMIEELTKSKQMADKIVDEKSQFVFLVTDQMNGVMNRVDNLCDDSLNFNIDNKVKSNILNIKQLVESSKIRINEMLNVSDNDVINLKITKNKFNFTLLINEIKYQTKDKIPAGVDFRVNIGDNIPNEIYGDSLKLKQVITTLLNNSIKYTKTGFIELRIAAIIKYNICRLIITVEDSGIGIDSETLNYILNDNNDLTDEDLNKNNGLNLNLKLVKKIVHLSGGVMTIDSTINKGTSIQLVMDQGLVENQNEGLEKYADEIMKKPKVAIITEDKKLEKFVEHLLEKNNFTTTIFTETKDCLDQIRNDEKYDLIVIDENMPKIPAIDLLHKLHDIQRFDGQIFVITKMKDFIHKKDLIDNGFNEVISNPLEKNEFLEKIKRIKK
jgi:signal transduction histidine kinase